jgi:hypothetical protein
MAEWPNGRMGEWARWAKRRRGAVQRREDIAASPHRRIAASPHRPIALSPIRHFAASPSPLLRAQHRQAQFCDATDNSIDSIFESQAAAVRFSDLAA